MYKVIRYFTDLQDNNYLYLEGDIFPRDGLRVSKERYTELSGSDNKQKTPLIKKLKDESQRKSANNDLGYTKTEINRMPTAELKQLAFDKGVENADMMTGAELKKHFISAFGL